MKKLIILTIILFTVQFLAPISAQTEQKPELIVQTGHTRSIYSIAFSPNNQIMASASGDNTIKLWNVRSGQELRTLYGHSFTVYTLVFSPDGRKLVSGSADKTVRLWDVESGQELKILFETTNDVNSVAFSPDGKLLASGDEDNIIKIWDLSLGKEFKILKEHKEPVREVAFSPNGKILASASQDGTIKLWDIVSGKVVKTLVGHTDYVFSIAFSPNGRIIASGSWDKTVKLWDVATEKELITLNENIGAISAITFSPNGSFLLFGGEGGTLKLWDVSSKSELRTFSVDNDKNRITDVKFSPNGKFFASASLNAIKTGIALREAKTGKILNYFTGYGTLTSSFTSSPNKKILAYKNGPYENKQLIVLDLTSGQKLLTVPTTYGESVKFSSDSKSLILLDWNNKPRAFRLWDLTTKQERRIPLKDYKDELSPDAETLASVTNDKLISLWDVTTGQLIRNFEENLQNIEYLMFLPDNITLVSTHNDTIKFWDLSKGQVRKEFKGQHLSSFSPDWKRFASVDENKKIHIWDVATGHLIREFTLAYEYEFSITFSQDGETIAINGLTFETTGQPTDQGYSRVPSSEIQLWNIESGKVTKALISEAEITSDLIIFSTDRKKIFVQYNGGGDIDSYEFWDIESGKIIKRISQAYGGNSDVLDAVSIIKTNFPDFFKTKDIEIQTFLGTSNKVNFYEGKSGKLITSFIALDDNNWAIISPDGRFDTSKLENTEGLHWIVPDAPFTPLSFEVFMRDYFEPKLLPRLLKCTEESNCDQEFKPVRDLSSLNRTQPKIEIKEIKKTALPDTLEVTVEAENVISEFQKGADKKPLNSGVFDLRLFRDGQMVEFSTSDESLQKTFRTYKDFDEELKVWRETNRVDLKDGKKTFSFQVKLPNAAAGKPVEFSAYAFNDDRVKSETSRQTFTLDKETNLQPKPRKAYVITFGVNRYENPAWDLQFAAADARAMREIVAAKLRGRKEFAEVVEIPLISDDEKTPAGKTIEKRDATKANLQTALDLLSGKTPTGERLKNLEKAIGAETMAKIKQANPDDMVLLSFSSHGYADRNGIFYILPTDIGKSGGRQIAPESLSRFISSDELSLWLRDVDAGEMVMIVDACYAASAVEGKDFKPAPMGSRGLGQLAFDKGMKILTATQAANVAVESGGSIGHGLLTYSLLREGLDKSQADFKAKDKTINLKEWLEFGEFRVPRLYEDLAKGNLKSINRGSEVIDLSGKNQTSLQTPTLFDFTRKAQEMILAQLP